MKTRIKHKIWTNLDNPKMHYSIRQMLVATKGLFLTPLHMPDGNRYYMSHYCGKVTKYTKDGEDRTDTEATGVAGQALQA